MNIFVVGTCARQVVVPLLGVKLGHQKGLGRVTLICAVSVFFRNLSAVLPFGQEFSERLKRCLVKGLDLQGDEHVLVIKNFMFSAQLQGRRWHALPADDQSSDRPDKPHWTDRLAHDFMELSWGWTPPTYGHLCVAAPGEKWGSACRICVSRKPFASAPAWELYAQNRRRLFSALSPLARPLAQETTSLGWKGMWKICVPVAGNMS